MTFDKSNVDLGEVKKGEKRTLEYQFTNTGTGPIQIEHVSACDCTTLDYPVHEIKPGEGGTITAVFDSSEEKDLKKVDITIILVNTDPRTGYPWVEELFYQARIIE